MSEIANTLTDKKSRYVALDGLRGIAALLVVFLHVDWTNHLTNNNFVRNGYLAVDLFFILSGFVIAANYSSRVSSLNDVRRFLVMRFFRLYPLHITVLAAFVSIEIAKLVAVNLFEVPVGQQAPFTGDSTWAALVGNIFLVHGLHLFDGPTWNGPSWSISCEFAAYVVFSFVFLFRLIKSPTYVTLGLTAAIAAYLLIAMLNDTLDVTADWGFVRCFAGFFIGTLIFAVSSRVTFLSRKFMILEIIVAVGILLAMSQATNAFVVGVVPLFVVLLLLVQSDRGPVAAILSSRIAQFLGKISYSIYMVHELIVVLMLIALKRLGGSAQFVNPEGRTTLEVDPWIGDGLTWFLVGFTILIATISYAYIEKPARAFGRRLALSTSPDRQSIEVSPQPPASTV